MTFQQTVNTIKSELPDSTWSVDQERIEGYLTEWRDRWNGHTTMLVTPRSTEHVSQIVKICAANNTPITTQGGNTGLVGGQIPMGEILLSTKYLNKIRSVSSDDMSIVCEAGVTLLDAQTAADAVNCKFPLSLASEGSCTIGGNLSTNAGGVHVIKYGTAKELCLGIEAVLANGEIFNGITSLRKDNTGYDLSRFLLGAEGTLGIITAASLKLFPKPSDVIRVLVGIESPTNALHLLQRVKIHPGLSMFELIPEIGMKAVTANVLKLSSPIEMQCPWYGLLEFELFGDPVDPINTSLEAALSEGEIIDAIMAKNQSESTQLLVLRENLSAAQKTLGASIKHDITVPMSKTPEFLMRANSAIAQAIPHMRPFTFGHMGDGNLHYNVTQPIGMNAKAFMKLEPEVNNIVYDLVDDLGGSISAEHGIGILKKDELARRASPTKLAAMRTIKTALDPKNILNPRLLLS